MSENVVMFKENDPELIQASKKSQETFKYFWRELHWEGRRIIPALDLAVVKVAFTDPDVPDGMPDTEHMWVSDIDFDGERIYGALISNPNWIKTVNEGDQVQIKLSELDDWLYSIQGKAYGGFSINVMRSRMSPDEMQDHDEAWGLDFGVADKIDLVHMEDKENLDSVLEEHPMCINMALEVDNLVQDSPEVLTEQDERGWTMLHYEALAGSTSIVNRLLEKGANAGLLTVDGKSALDLANVLSWSSTANLLRVY